MNQKEKSLLVLKALFYKKDKINKDYLMDRIDNCSELKNPEVLLDENDRRVYEMIIKELRSKGKIV